MTTLPLLSREEIILYFNRINFEFKEQELPQPTLDNLKELHRRHVCAVPFENFSLHYSKERKIVPTESFNKIVLHQRGGYCFENNGLFTRVLRTLGYKVYNITTRVFEAKSIDEDPDAFTSLSHFIEVVWFGGDDYWLADVGFGAKGLFEPIRLKEEEVNTYLGSEKHKLVKRKMNMSSSFCFGEQPPTWMLLHKMNEEEDWTVCMAFHVVEAFWKDAEFGNFWTSGSPHSIFNRCIMAARSFVEDGEYCKYTLLNDTMKLRKSGRVVEVQKFKTEKERVDALSKCLGIHLSKEDAEAIRGTSLCLDSA